MWKLTGSLSPAFGELKQLMYSLSVSHLFVALVRQIPRISSSGDRQLLRGDRAPSPLPLRQAK